MSQIVDEVLQANATYVANFGAKSKLPLPPARRFAILTCMDARLQPSKFAGLAEGDPALVGAVVAMFRPVARDRAATLLETPVGDRVLGENALVVWPGLLYRRRLMGREAGEHGRADGSR